MITNPALTSVITWHRPSEEMTEACDRKLVCVRPRKVRMGIWHTTMQRWDVPGHGWVKQVLAWADPPQPPEEV